MTRGICTETDCGRDAWAVGLCRNHHQIRWRAEHPERVRELKRRHYERYRDEIAAKRKEARKRPEVRTIESARYRAWRAANPEKSAAKSRRYFHSEQGRWKQSARIVVREAVRKGILVKPVIARCGHSRPEAHHPDYNRPLDVLWLCRPCHQELHRQEAAA